MEVGGQRHAAAALTPGMTWHPMYRRLGGPQGRSGRVWKILPVPRFDSRIVPPLAFPDSAIPNHGQQNVETANAPSAVNKTPRSVRTV